MLKKLLIFLGVVFASATYADEVQFVMSAPNAVNLGDQFRLSFSTNESGKNLRLPDLSNFEVLMGPSTSQSTSIQIINGRTTQSANYSYIYILRAKSEGAFTIRPASIEIKGKVYESNSLQIQVVKGRQQPQQQQSSQGSKGSQQAPSGNIGNDDLFVRVSLSKQNVYKGEQIIATVKLYARPDLPLSGFEEVNLPTYEGFYTQDIDIPQQINFEREVYNDKIYQVGVLKKTVLFPQQTGRITIQPFDITCLVRQQIRQRSFFDDFFDSYRTVRAKITGPSVAVNVRDLPPAPADFYGGVGNFSMNAALSETDISANDAATVKLTISGNGNIRLIQNPKLVFPPDFEVYDPKSTDNIQTGGNGMSGSKTIEYLFQPRFEGDYTIPSANFAYFNPATGQYSTLSTPEFKLHVKKGTGDQNATVVSSLRKEDVQLIGQDIRYIKQNNEKLYRHGHTFFGSTGFYLLYLASAAVFAALFIIYRKKVRENANIALTKNKKANRVAQKRLREAAGFMKNNQNEAFYESVLKSFWGYLSDKLGIDMASLNRETAIESLQQKQVGAELIESLIRVIEQCEYARYAPSGGNEARHELYNQAVSVMSSLEKQIKR